MHPAIKYALIAFVVGIVLIFLDYNMATKKKKEIDRKAGSHGKTDKARVEEGDKKRLWSLIWLNFFISGGIALMTYLWMASES